MPTGEGLGDGDVGEAAGTDAEFVAEGEGAVEGGAGRPASFVAAPLGPSRGAPSPPLLGLLDEVLHNASTNRRLSWNGKDGCSCTTLACSTF
jgi:hypothetical protein|tara:strand:- start:245 stop:520 length:276 start_codon:yes stop_codon:yes gene_type:complete